LTSKKIPHIENGIAHVADKGLSPILQLIGMSGPSAPNFAATLSSDSLRMLLSS